MANDHATDDAQQPAAEAGDPRLDQLEAAACLRWTTVPEALRSELRTVFAEALAAADAAEAETIPVMNPTLRPQRLRLQVLAADRSQDAMYQQEWCELSAAANGALYLVYRRRDGDTYAVRYDGGVTMPEALAKQLPGVLAEAILGGDG